MIELDRLRYDIVHGTPADLPAAHYPPLPPAAPRAVAFAAAVLAGYGLTRPRGFWRLAFLSAGAGLAWYAWDKNRSFMSVRSQAAEPGEEHPLDIAGHGSFPASDPPSLNPTA